MPDQMPSARPRFSAGNASESSVSVSGATIAPPRPWIARAAISASVEGASAASGRGGREDPDPDQEHAPAAEAVAERRAGEQEDGERERVGVDGPLEVLERGAEIAADARQRRRDDEVVERDHEDRDGGDREGDEAALRHCRTSGCE